MSFGAAVEIMRNGGRVTREGWRDHERKWIKRVEIESAEVEVHWHPFIVMKTRSSKLIPYLASPVDIFATDWVEVK